MSSTAEHANPRVPDLATPVLCAVLALYSLIHCFALSQKWDGEDFFLHWCVARVLTDPTIGDIYTPQGAERIAQRTALLAPSSNRVQRMHRKHPRPLVRGTPFLYACHVPFVSDDYETDYLIYRLILLASLVFAVWSFTHFFGIRTRTAFLLLSVTTFAFEPVLSVMRTSNLGTLQLGMLALVGWAHRLLNGPVRDIVAGSILGLSLAFKPNLAVALALYLLALAFARETRPVLRTAASAIVSTVVAGLVSQMVMSQPAAWSSWMGQLSVLVDQPPSVRLGNYALPRLIQHWFDADLTWLLWFATTAAALVSLWNRRFQRDLDSQRAVLALALGSAIVLLCAPIAWLHYYVLMVPLAVACLQPGTGRLVTARIVTTAVLLTGIGLYPLVQTLMLRDAITMATWCVGSAIGLFVLGCLAPTGPFGDPPGSNE